jgi:MFS family permease
VTTTPSPSDAAFRGRNRTLAYASAALVVVSSVVVALAVTFDMGGHWEWGPFFASLFVTAVGVACIEGLRRGMVVRAKPTPEQLTRFRESRRVRNPPLNATYMALAIGVGLISGAIPSYWPVVGLALFILAFGIVLPVAILALVRRRAALSRQNDLSP